MKKRTQKSKNKEIVVYILNTEYKVIVCWGDSRYLLKKAHKWGFDDLTLEGFNERLKQLRGVTLVRPRCHPVIALPSRPDDAYKVSTLAHESCHAVADICKYLDITLDGEFFAHSVGAVVRKVLE